MSKWDEYGIEEKVLYILRDVPDSTEGHHSGRPFLTAYQLAISYGQHYPEDVSEMGYQVGGLGIEERVSLAQYLDRELSRRINSGHIEGIEGAFLLNNHLHDISFNKPTGDEIIRSSLTQTPYPLSMFRLRAD